MLKSVTQHLVDVHGQSEHFFLLNESNQLKVIDGLLGQKAEQIKSELTATISEKKEYKAKISALGGDEAERERRLEILNFQINEIDGADLKQGEFEELKTRQNLILNIEKIMSSIGTAKSILDDDGGCCDGISSAIREINRISGINDEYSKISARLESLNAEAQDICQTLSDMEDNLSFDEREAQYIDERINLIKALKKKYGADEEEILSFSPLT